MNEAMNVNSNAVYEIAKANQRLVTRIKELEKENQELNCAIKHVTEQWEIWCEAYQNAVNGIEDDDSLSY